MKKNPLPQRNLQARPVSTNDPLLTQKTLDATLKHYLLACKVEGFTSATLKNHKFNLGRFINFLLSQDVSQAQQVTANDVRAYLGDCGDRGLSNVSIHDYFRDIRRFFNWMVEQGQLEYSPCALIKPPKFTRKIVQTLSKTEVQLLLRLCDEKSFNGLRDRAILIMFLDTGLRLSELASLTIADVSIERETLKVRNGKGQKERLLHFGKVAQLALLRYLTIRTDTSPALWVSSGGQAIEVQGHRMIVRRLKIRSGITGVRVSPHTFRHTFAINYLRNGGDVFTLQSILGHSSLEMTRRYTSMLNAEDAIERHKIYSPADTWEL